MNLVAKILAVLFMTGSLAQAAYFTADYVTPGEDATLGTHIIVSGNGMEVARSWLEIARTQAMVYGDKARHGKIRIIGAYTKDADLNYPRSWRYSNIHATSNTFNATRLLEALSQVQKIASIDFVGHNGAILGFALESYQFRFFLPAVTSFATFKNRFTKDAYVRLYGCNTGWNLAPAIAKEWGVPTAGSFTSEDIQFLHSNNTWYFQEPGLYPSGGMATYNKISFGKTEACQNGGCSRLKASYSAYSGTHGKYVGTLPFMKFFCGSVPESDCFRRMAQATEFQIGVVHFDGKPRLEAFAENLADQFCNAYAVTTPYDLCISKVKSHLLSERGTLPPSYSPISGPMLNCSFQKCTFKTVCQKNCDLVGDLTKMSTNFVDELNAYKRGFESWN
jgi:hypothetical protein